jgi:hypothetical protein
MNNKSIIEKFGPHIRPEIIQILWSHYLFYRYHNICLVTLPSYPVFINRHQKWDKLLVQLKTNYSPLLCKLPYDIVFLIIEWYT